MDVQKTIEIVFAGTDNTGNAISSVGAGLSSFSASAQQITAPLADFTKSLLVTEAAIGAVAIAALGFAFNEAVSFESSMLDLQKVLSDSEGSAEGYADRITDLGGEFGVMSTAVIQSAVNFKQAGFSIDESLQLVEQSLIAVKTADLDADQASSLLIATLKGFGSEAGEASRVLDVWNQVSNNFATSAGELAIGMAELSPIAKAAGLSFEETAGLLTPIIEVFGSGSEAANALKTGLLRLADPAKETADALLSLGINTKTASGELLPVSDILAQLGGKWGDLTNEQQLSYASMIFGINQAGKLSVVLGDYNKVLSITKSAQEGAGASLAELAVRQKAAELQLQRLNVAFNNAAITIGTKYKTELTGVIISSTGLIKSFDEVIKSGGLEPLFDLLRPLLIEFSSNIDKIAENLPAAFAGLDFSGIADSLKSLSGSFNVLFDGLDLTTVDGLQKALQFVIDSSETLIRVTGGIVEGFKPFVDLIITLVEEANDSGDNVKQLSGEILGFATGLNSALGALSTFGSLLEGVGGTFIALVGGSSIINAGAQLASMGLSVSTVGTSLAALLKPLTAVTAAFATGLGIGSLLNEFTPIQSLLADLIDDFTGLNDEVEKALSTDHISPKTAEQLQISADAADQAKESLSGLVAEFGNYNKDARTAEQVSSELAATMKDAGLIFDETTNSYIKIADANKKLIDTFSGSNEALKTYTNTQNELVTVAKGINITIGEDGVIAFGDGAKGVGGYSKSLKDAKDETDKAKESSEEFLAKMEDIASNERIKTFELTVDMKVAQVEADAKTTIAAFDSIASTIVSTNELILGLSLAEAPEWDKFGFGLKRRVESAEDRAGESHEAQLKLVAAQTELMEAQAKRIDQGDALLTIESDGLEPHLRAFMWEILKKLRVEMSQNYQNFLVGGSCGGGA